MNVLSAEIDRLREQLEHQRLETIQTDREVQEMREERDAVVEVVATQYMERFQECATSAYEQCRAKLNDLVHQAALDSTDVQKKVAAIEERVGVLEKQNTKQEERECALEEREDRQDRAIQLLAGGTMLNLLLAAATGAFLYQMFSRGGSDGGNSEGGGD